MAKSLTAKDVILQVEHSFIDVSQYGQPGLSIHSTKPEYKRKLSNTPTKRQKIACGALGVQKQL